MRKQCTFIKCIIVLWKYVGCLLIFDLFLYNRYCTTKSMVFCYICNLILVDCMIVPQFLEALLLEELQMLHLCSPVNNMWYILLNYVHVSSVDVAALSLLHRKRLNPALKKSSTTTSKYTVRPSKCLKCLLLFLFPALHRCRGRGWWWTSVVSAHLDCVLFFSPIRSCQGPIVISSKFLENVGKIGL